MADKNPFGGLGLGQLGAERQYMGSLAKKLAPGFNPLQYAAGYALNSLLGPTEIGEKLMGEGAKAPVKAAIGQGLSAPSAPIIPPNGGIGLAAPTGMIDYKPKSDILNQPTTTPSYQLPTSPATQQSVFDKWSKLSFSYPTEEE